MYVPAMLMYIHYAQYNIHAVMKDSRKHVFSQCTKAVSVILVKQQKISLH